MLPYKIKEKNRANIYYESNWLVFCLNNAILKVKSRVVSKSDIAIKFAGDKDADVVYMLYCKELKF